MKKILIIIALIIGYSIYQKENKVIIPNESIRIRIIANSNEIEDLIEKKNIKEKIEDELFELISKCNNINEARDVINKNSEKVDSIIKNNINTKYHINYGINYFPKKVYRDIIYKEGNYESLVITLGEGLGENWWCVLYPPLCLIDENTTTSDVEYKSYILELLK